MLCPNAVKVGGVAIKHLEGVDKAWINSDVSFACRQAEGQYTSKVYNKGCRLMREKHL